MLYTGKGDKGTTKLFNCPPGIRISKSDFVFSVLGVLDELGSSLGYAKALSTKEGLSIKIEGRETPYSEIIEELQQNLFVIQAKIAGSEKTINKKHLGYLEKVIFAVEEVLPPIKSFKIAGGEPAGAYLDIARTISRKAERNVIKLTEKTEIKIQDYTLPYLNRLSSILYALARFANFQKGFKENSPDYQ